MVFAALWNIHLCIYTLRVVPPAFSADGPKMRITFCVERKDCNRAEKVTASSRTQLEQQRSLHEMTCIMTQSENREIKLGDAKYSLPSKKTNYMTCDTMSEVDRAKQQTYIAFRQT